MENDIMQKVLVSVKPSASEEEEIRKRILNFLAELNNSLKKGKIKAQAEVGGSFAKGTTIKKEKYDVDVFAVFDKKYEKYC